MKPPTRKPSGQEPDRSGPGAEKPSRPIECGLRQQHQVRGLSVPAADAEDDETESDEERRDPRERFEELGLKDLLSKQARQGAEADVTREPGSVVKEGVPLGSHRRGNEPSAHGDAVSAPQKAGEKHGGRNE